ncbi:kinesin-like protein KIN-14O [Iris pallida]|uniref:Kinesin-like protein KIN-14O n=1 Tax=Iris pallida TaxID=29817 RepID=A0AAX6EPK5_IRIPA|nr:kinesin-like protein KIN-14O [Iris pallida]
MFVLVSFSVPHVSSLRLKQRSLYAQRRDTLNKILDIKGMHKGVLSIWITVKSVGGAKKEFTSDRLFAKEATQKQVFHEVELILISALNGTMFASLCMVSLEPTKHL